MSKKLTVLLLLLGCYSAALSQIFTVTTNADSGPGSLREAITLANANGTATTDRIEFNIPQTDFNTRIINLVTELPSLTSNIIIDGTTQPGNSYGTTNAKICLKKNDYAPSFSVLRIENANDVKIYGMYLYYGYWQGFFGGSTPRSKTLYGIELINAKNIVIGAPGKGNVINGCEYGIFSNTNGNSNIIIQSNYLGIGKFYDNASFDIDPAVLTGTCSISLANVKDITIGGSTAQEGNIIGCPQRGVYIDSRNSTGNGFIKIRNNKFGRGYDGIKLIKVGDFWDAYITIGRSRNGTVDWSSNSGIDYRVELLDNDIPNHVRIGNTTDSIIVQRNIFGEDGRGMGASFKLHIAQTTSKGIIGGEDESNANYFLKKIPNTYNNSLAISGAGAFTILKNVFDCNSSFASTTSVFYDYANPKPWTQVDLTTPSSVKGRATPNARIDLYYDDPCTACEGKLYLATVRSDAAGNWQYNGAITGTVVTTATTDNGYTGEFSFPTFKIENRVVKQPTCGKKNGSITGITSEGAETYFWLNYVTKDTVSRTIDLLNAGPGHYLLYGVHGGTCINTINQTIELTDITPKILPNWVSLKQPSCGLSNGSITGMQVENIKNSKLKWLNSAGMEISNQRDILNIGPGTYRFVVIDTTLEGACSDTAIFVLSNQSGPSVNTNDIRLSASTCAGSNGSISGIKGENVTGTPFLQWVDSTNKPIGNSYDLLNVKAGKYRFKFKDATGCDTIITSFYVVPDDGSITIDVTNKKITASSCSGATGSIEGLKISGGAYYKWINTANNAVAGTSVDVLNLSPGNYQLIVTNDFGCTNTSAVINIPQSTFNNIEVTNVASKDALCEQPSGFINISGFNKDATQYSFTWVNEASGQVLGNGTSIANLHGGTYALVAKDNSSCEKKIFTAVIKNIPKPVFNYAQVQVKDDNCNLKAGSISALKVDGLVGPTTYTWVDENNVTVGSNINLQNRTAGTYTLKITDGGICNIQSNPVVIKNSDEALATPQYSDLIIPRFTEANLKIKNKAVGSYILSAGASGAPILQQNSEGDFTISNITSDTSFYIKSVNGTCSSAVARVNIKVVDQSYFAIPTAFTPNGDGKNDRLSVRVIGFLEIKYFRIYNRWGQVIFETAKLGDGWNGMTNGVMQNPGTFVWIAEGKDMKGKAIINKGSFVLIR